MADNFFVTAIVVTHDGSTWLAREIAAIFAQTRKVDRIIAVDNGSIDSSPQLLKQSGITVLKSDREAGFGDAIDLALAQTKGIKSEEQEELLWILHDDVAPDRDALKFLIEGIADKPQVALVGPKLRGWYDRTHLLEIGISIAVNGARWNSLEDGEQDQGQYSEQEEVLAVSTAAMLVRRKVFEDLGGFDPNLALFRDDVDFGWRVRVAGYSVLTVPKALVFHAEAAASERRSVDVEEAYFHRPHLLDRRNAAYVLLANVSWWLIPWVSIQLIGTATIRAIGYLVAKLPGYAADEVGAVAYILVKPGALLRARKFRKSKRLLAPSIIRQYIPPAGSQIRLAWERSTQAIGRFIRPRNSGEEPDGSISYSDIGVIDESFDDQDLAVRPKKSRWQSLKNRPLLFGILLTALISLISARNRFGSLSGGALPVAHSGAHDLFTKFGESWHLVGLGSSAPTPPWVAIVGLASGITLGNVSAFISLLFLLTPPIAFFVMYRTLKRYGIGISFSAVGGVIYAMSPVVWASINEGRLGTLVLALLIPSFLSLNPIQSAFQISSWRRIYSIALFAGLISSFSSLFLLIWTLVMATLLTIDLYKNREEVKKLKSIEDSDSVELSQSKRLFAYLAIPVLTTAPWSFTLFLHPTQFLLDPGLPLSGGKIWETLLLNPGGPSSVPGWIVAPLSIFLIFMLFSKKYLMETLVAISLLTVAVLLSHVHISGHGSNSQVWLGTIILFIEVLIIAPGMQIITDLVPKLRGLSLGFRHFALAVTALVTVFSLSATSFWALTSGANSLVASNQPEIVPAFISSLSETPNKPKTLVISRIGDQINYFITRGMDLELGDPDVAVAAPAQIQSAVVDLISGAGITSSKIIGAYGINYLYIKNPVDKGIVRTIDGIGGFTRSAATSAGIVWKVAGSYPRVSILDATGIRTTLNSNDVGAQAVTQTPGLISLAEKFDGGWRLLLNGKSIKLEKSVVGLPTFNVEESGDINIVHDGTTRRALLSLEFIVLITVIILALPAGRRRREVPLEELV